MSLPEETEKKGMEQIEAQKTEASHIDDNDSKYLIYRLSEEQYASPLLSIKEVIKVPEIKPVPYMKDYFRGVINLRGQIVSVIDLRIKFNQGKSDFKEGLIIVVETENSLIGAVVDDIVSVARFEDSNVDRNPKLETRVPLEFFRGVAKHSENLINLIDISSCLGADEMRKIRQAAKAA